MPYPSQDKLLQRSQVQVVEVKHNKRGLTRVRVSYYEFIKD
jgi:hypothetical protein